MRGTVRKKERALSLQEAIKIIENADYGVLATVNENNCPCTVALNHVMLDEKTILFHGGLNGEKVDNIAVNPNVSFFVVDKHEVLYDQFTVLYKSAVAHGTAELIREDTEKQQLMEILVARFSDESVPDQKRRNYIAKGLPAIVVIKMTIEHLTAKERASRKRPGLDGML